jgi:hypothetical protein
MLEFALVGAVVAVAFAYSGWALLPAATKVRLARALAEQAGKSDPEGWMARVARRLERAAGAGDCSGCSADSSAVPGRGRSQPPR